MKKINFSLVTLILILVILSVFTVYFKKTYINNDFDAAVQKLMEEREQKLRQDYEKFRKTKYHPNSNFFASSLLADFFADLPCKEIYQIINFFSEMLDTPLQRQISLMSLVSRLSEGGFNDKAMQLLKLIESSEDFKSILKTLDGLDDAFKEIYEKGDPDAKSKAFENLWSSELSETISRVCVANDGEEVYHDDIRNTTCSKLVKDLLKIGDTNRALKLADTMSKNQMIYHDTMKDIMFHLVKEGEIDKVLELNIKDAKECIASKVPSFSTQPIDDIVTYLTENGEIDKALDVADLVEEELFKTTADGIRDEIYSILIDKQLKNGDTDEALKLASSLINFENIVNQQVKIAKTLVLSGKTEESRELFKSIIDSIGTEDRGWKNAINQFCYDDVAMGLAECGEIEWSKSIFDKSVKIIEQRGDDSFSQITFWNIVNSGFQDWGLNLADKYYKDDVEKNLFYSYCENRLVNNNKIDLAKDFLMKQVKISDEYIDDVNQTNPLSSDSYKRDIALRLASYGMLDLAFERVNTISDDAKKSSAKNEIIKMMIKNTPLDGFENFLDMLLDNANACKNLYQRDKIFFDIAKLLLEIPCSEQQKYINKFITAYEMK